MSNYEIAYDKRVIKYFRKLSKKDVKLTRKLLLAIKDIKINPYDSKKLKGKFEGLNRVKVANHRIIFKIHKEELIILVVEMGKRSNIYK